MSDAETQLRVRMMGSAALNKLSLLCALDALDGHDYDWNRELYNLLTDERTRRHRLKYTEEGLLRIRS